MSFIQQIKGLGKDTVIYGLGNALGQLIGVVTAPILTRIFVPADYGVIALLQTAIGLLVVIIGFNLNSGIYFYYFEYEEPYKKRVILSTSFFFYLAAGLLLGIMIWTGAPFLKDILISKQMSEELVHYDYVKYIQILSIGVFFSIMDTNFRSLLQMRRQAYKYMALNILQVVSNLILIILLVVYWEWGIEGALWSGVISSMLVASVGFLMVMRYYVLNFSITLMKLFLSYSLPQFPAVFLNWGLLQLNVFFINYYALLADQGYYAIAWKVASVFLLFTTAFRLAWSPFALSIKKEEHAKQTYSQAYTLHVIVFGLLGAFIALFAKPILLILTPEDYHVAYSIVFILTIGFLYQSNNNILGLGIALSKKTKYISYAQVVSFSANIGLNFLLTPVFGAWGAAMAFTGGMIVQSFSYYYFAQRVYHIPYPFWRLQKFCLMLLLVVALEAYLVHSLDFIYSTLMIVPFTVILGMLAWKMGLTHDERTQILKFRYMWNERNLTKES